MQKNSYMPEHVKRIALVTDDENLKKILYFCFDGWGYEVFLLSTAALKTNTIKKISPDAIVIDVAGARKEDLAFCLLLKQDFITAFIPLITLIDKRHLRQELLHSKYGVDDYLIKPPDPLDLRVRIEMALKRSRYNYCCHPLTGLPGSPLIEDVLNDCIKSKKSFFLGYVDIDNFKFYNDVYGYLRGDRIIMQTAYILYTSLKHFGTKNDFLGHIGGDDFVFISFSEDIEPICRHTIFLFDALMPFHYTKEDRQRGYIIAKDRRRKFIQVGLVSLSIALVNQSSEQPVLSIIQINERITELKRYLKEIPGSKFMVDRRNQPKNRQIKNHAQGFLKKDIFGQVYQPLGQILLEKKLLTSEQLDEALRIHWRRDVPLGDTLVEMGLVSPEQIQAALIEQKERLLPVLD
ncbi:MAG: diguanylate cyclase [Candidatus Omnitrophica bacterium]|nr:diguanylate cyclase [Candidatus Omnitrophota bacterium]